MTGKIEWSWYHDKCGTRKKYSERYDAYYCSTCDEYLEVACSDPQCGYCVDRPSKPPTKRWKSILTIAVLSVLITLFFIFT